MRLIMDVPLPRAASSPLMSCVCSTHRKGKTSVKDVIDWGSADRLDPGTDQPHSPPGVH